MPSVRLRSWIALVAFVGALGLPLVTASHLAPDDDAACGLVVLVPGSTTAEVGEAQDTLPPGHCALCHWLRAVGGAQPAVAKTVVAWLEPVGSEAPLVAPDPHFDAVADSPSRAPPVSFS